ncbi:MAG TPA: hypothetical protein VM261_14920 [Kofleriaceae bacterium]|nr:hypothetical protein [Kofleriaceae bacterium]
MQRFTFALGLGLLAAACGGPQSTAVDAAGTDAPASPTLTVTASPTTVARGEAVTLTVSVTNFTIVNPTSGAPVRDGEGHYHYYLDDSPDYTAAWSPTVTFRPTASTALGPHTLRFVLATGAHQPVQPLVETTASFTVQ